MVLSPWKYVLTVVVNGPVIVRPNKSHPIDGIISLDLFQNGINICKTSVLSFVLSVIQSRRCQSQ